MYTTTLAPLVLSYIPSYPTLPLPLLLLPQRGRRFFPNNAVVECVVEAYLPMVPPLFDQS